MDIEFIIGALIFSIVVVGVGFLWRFLLFLIAKKVAIIIDENKITLSSKVRTITINPCVYISKTKKRNKLLGIGDPPKLNDDYFEANILNPSEEAKLHAPIETYIEVFFRSAFFKLFNRRALLFTETTIKGADKFQCALGNDFAEKFDKCLELALSIKRHYIK